MDSKENKYDDIIKKLGTRIKQYRVSQNMTQLDLEKKTGISAAYISQIENGKRDNLSLNTLFLISEGLNVEISRLYSQDSSGMTQDIIENDKIIDSFYPAQYGNYQVTTLMEFLLYLPLIDDEMLMYDVLYRIGGNCVNNENYVCKKLNWLISTIPDSPAKRYSNHQVELMRKRRKDPAIGIQYDKDEYENYVQLLEIKYEKAKYERLVENIEKKYMELKEKS